MYEFCGFGVVGFYLCGELFDEWNCKIVVECCIVCECVGVELVGVVCMFDWCDCGGGNYLLCG